MALNCLNIYKKGAQIRHKKKPTINGRLKRVLRYEKLSTTSSNNYSVVFFNKGNLQH